MSSPLKFLDSSIGRKVLMSLTGLFLTLFLIVHVSGNLQLFKADSGLAFNEYSVFMTTFPPIKIISYLLYASIILHVISALRLTIRNRAARNIGYKAPKDPRSSTWASKNMGILGTIILIFLVTHMFNFWYQYKFGDIPWVQYQVDQSTGHVLSASPADLSSGPIDKPHEYTSQLASGVQVKVMVVKDLYGVVKTAFQQSWLVALYILGMIALAYHLVHGFQSAFQSLGIRKPSYAPLIRGIGVWVFGIIIPILFAAMPVYFFFIMK